ncbi:MAG TPA: conjugal transfer protein TraX [Candidatus Dorea intestinavium]|nr:conjugal transfer protein TraX [Candidatus Dorea intestinavium]
MQTTTLTTTNNKKGISSNVLKIIGIITMFMDHLYEFFHAMGAPIFLRMVGRITLPIFLFTCAEGFHYTHNRAKYLARLLIGFWAMGLINQLLPKVLYLEGMELINNVFGTMAASVMVMWTIDLMIQGLKRKKMGHFFLGLGLLLTYVVLSVGSLFLLMKMPMVVVRISQIIPLFTIVEGGVTAVLLTLAFYLLRKNRLLQVVALLVFSLPAILHGDIQGFMALAALPILFYNGKKGGNFGGRYFFYFFYPIHIYVLYSIAVILLK